MSFANFGIGIGALAQGLNNGIDIGTKLQKVNDERKLRAARKQGMTDAKQARQSAIDGLVQTGSAPSADNTMTVPTYQVGGQSYADEGSARTAAESQVGSLDEFYQKVAAPKIYEQMLETDPEKAAAWKNWNENEGVKTGQKHWAAAIAKANAGDFEGFGKSLMKAYNTRGYFDDGTEVKDWKTIKDDKGNITGAELTFKSPDGKEYKQTINGMEDAYRAGASLLSPENVFNTGWNEIMSAKKAQLAAAQSNQKFQQDVIRDDRKATNQSKLQTQRDEAATDRMVTGKQMDAANKQSAVDAKAGALKRAGYSDAFIKENLPALLGIGEYKKAAAPGEVRRMLHQARLSADFNYARKSPDEQAAIIAQDMKLINGGEESPMAGGIPQSPAAPSRNAPMIYDTRTGKMVPYTR